MALHLIKLAVGAETAEDIDAWQARRLASEGEVAHVTRVRPKRAEEVTDGGSLYWVVKGQVRARQRILALDARADEAGRACCAIVLEPKLVLTRPQPRRPFQGWRYLDPAEAPVDLAVGEAGALPPELHSELAALGLL